jgi:S-adenosyl-L-methionine hydrolase (adenosine-forming)
MKRPLIALLTDFGCDDWYVGAMKGAAKSVCPDADIVDISHGISPQDVLEGAFVLAASHDAFPGETIFVAVVDPGVGSGREGVLLRAGAHWFVGPNNGIFSLVAERHESVECRLLSEPRFFRPQVSSTFHGRDVFAPVAAHLACGVAVEELAPTAVELVRFELPPVEQRPSRVSGVIIHFDRFGNAITNIERRHLERLGEKLLVAVGKGLVGPLHSTFSDVPPAAGVAYVGSAGYVEIAINCGNARDGMGLELRQRVTIHGA